MTSSKTFDIDIIISNSFTSFTQDIIKKNNSEVLKYYIDESFGWKYLDSYSIGTDGTNIRVKNNIKLFSVGNNQNSKSFIKNIFNRLDNIIDLDFEYSVTDNGSEIDIFAVNYSSTFSEENVIGQVIGQSSVAGKWWEVLWKRDKNNKELNDLEKNTIIHELGHSLGLRHPNNDPENKRWDTSDTVMSYNMSQYGWDVWYSENDINALIKIWGRENDKNYWTIDSSYKKHRYKKSKNEYYIITKIGEEKITEINEIQFNDKTINIANDIISVFNLVNVKDEITGKIYRLYSAAFGRFPDLEGYDYWINNNKSGIDTYIETCNSFIESEEFINQYGINQKNSTYIDNLYQNILSREPDIAGQNYWLNQLNRGIENKTKVLIGFAESEENKNIFNIEVGF